MPMRGPVTISGAAPITAARAHLDRPAGQRNAVQVEVDAQRLRELARSGAEVLRAFDARGVRASTRRRRSGSSARIRTAAASPSGSATKLSSAVDPVGQVHVRVTGRAEQHPVALGEARRRRGRPRRRRGSSRSPRSRRRCARATTVQPIRSRATACTERSKKSGRSSVRDLVGTRKGCPGPARGGAGGGRRLLP